MNPKQYVDHIQDFFFRGLELVEKKSADYSNQDPHSSFKLVGQMLNLAPEKVILVMMATKVVRVDNLLSNNKQAKNESVTDSLLDLANYSGILDALIKDQGKP